MPATPPPATGPSADRAHRSVPSPAVRLLLALALGALCSFLAASASALPATPALAPPSASPQMTAPAPASRESPTPDPAPDRNSEFRLGALAGVGFPRPMSFEAFARLGGNVGLGAEYGLLPSVTIDGVAVSAWAASLDLRLFPFHGAFFFATRAGYQHLDGSATVTVASVGAASGSATMETWFVNPRLGFLWTMKYGFSVAIEAGVQLPIASSFSSTLPSAVAARVRTSTPVDLLTGALPTVDLLRIGMLF